MDCVCVFCGKAATDDATRVRIAGQTYHRACWKEQLFAGRAKPIAIGGRPHSAQPQPQQQQTQQTPPTPEEQRRLTRRHGHRFAVRGDASESPSPPPQEPLTTPRTRANRSVSVGSAADAAAAPPLPPPPAAVDAVTDAALPPATAAPGRRLPKVPWMGGLFGRFRAAAPSSDVAAAAAAASHSSVAAAAVASAAPVERELRRALVDASCIELGEKIGEGASGVVFRGTFTKRKIGSQQHQKVVAVKQIRSPEFLTPEQREEFIREVTLLKRLKSPHIVAFVGVVASGKDCLWLVTEHVAGGTLREALAPRNLSWEVRVRIAFDVARGLQVLHENKIVHRDLKSDNVLVASLAPDAPSTIKLIDFGASRKIKDDSQRLYTKGVGTPIYMSPEILQGQPYSQSTDVFSFGVLLWELCTQKTPYSDFESSWKVTQFVVEGKRLPLSPSTPPEIAALVSACWAQQPIARPKLSFVCKALAKHGSTLAHHHN